MPCVVCTTKSSKNHWKSPGLLRPLNAWSTTRGTTEESKGLALEVHSHTTFRSVNYDRAELHLACPPCSLKSHVSGSFKRSMVRFMSATLITISAAISSKCSSAWAKSVHKIPRWECEHGTRLQSSLGSTYWSHQWLAQWGRRVLDHVVVEGQIREEVLALVREVSGHQERDVAPELSSSQCLGQESTIVVPLKGTLDIEL